MKISYRKELEKAARQMILIHRTDTLIKLILRTVIRSLRVSHVGIFLFDKERNGYVLTVSKGEKGIKIPSGLVKISRESPLIKHFSDKNNLKNESFLIIDRIKKILRKDRIKNNYELKLFFRRLLYQMSIYKIKVAFPITFREELLGVFLLGEKTNKKDFVPDELTFLSILSSDVAMAIRNASLFEDLRVQLKRNQSLFLQTITALAEAIEAKDKYTSGHTERVAQYCFKIAHQLKKMRKIKNWEKFQNDLRVAALLHDIGKIGVSEKILNKRNPLNDKEWEVIKAHPLVGEEILSPIKDLKEVILAVRHHHERYDGRGYPYGLKGKKVPLIAGLISVADAYDAMISHRPYRKALTKKEAIEIIKKNSGTQFHPKIVEAFLKTVGDEK